MKPTPFQNIVEGVKDLQHALPRAKAPIQQELSSQEEDMRIPPSRGDQDKGSLNDEVFSHDEEEEKEELERASNVVTTRGDPPLFGDADEEIASTIGALVSLQEVPRDLTYEDQEQHVSMLIGNDTKQWKKYVPMLTIVFGTYTLIYHSLVIDTFDTNEMLGVKQLIKLEEDTYT